MKRGRKPLHSGFLRLKGRKIKVFRTFWFELENERLSYYKAQNHKKPAGVIELGSDVEIVMKNNTFVLKGTNLPHDLEMSGTNKDDNVQWTDQIRKVIMKSKHTSKMIIGEELNFFTKKRGSIHPDDFEEIGLLGKGKFGKVVKVRKRNSGEIFAMKILRKEIIAREGMIEYALAEKEILSKIDNPFVVKLHYSFQTEKKLYLVEEFLSGGSLYNHLETRGRFDVDRARFYTAEVIVALENLHKENIIYKDLKPDNCLLNFMGHVVLTDIGMAQTTIDTVPIDSKACFSAEYTPPEVIKGDNVNKAVDWWTVGIFLHELLSGEPPFYSEGINDLFQIILKDDLQMSHDIQQDAQDLIEKLLEKDPKKRIGAGPTDAADIKAHPFFQEIDWEKLGKFQVKPPFLPDLKKIDEMKYQDSFDDDDLVNVPDFPKVWNSFPDYDFQKSKKITKK